MQFQLGLISAVTACVLFLGNPSLADDPESAYRILPGPVACLPCGGAPYVLIDSQDRVHDLYAELKEICRELRWRANCPQKGISLSLELLRFEQSGTNGLGFR
jgi:hypothetical protein